MKNPLATSRLTLQQYGIQLPETESEVKGLMKEVTRQQENALMMALRGKSIHGAHHKTLEGDGIDQASTETLIIAAQDGGIVMRKYQSEVWATRVDPTCQKCGDGVESIGHIIVSPYESSKWLGYKEHHDNVLGELTKAVTSKWRVTDQVQVGSVGMGLSQ